MTELLFYNYDKGEVERKRIDMEFRGGGGELSPTLQTQLRGKSVSSFSQGAFFLYNPPLNAPPIK